MHGNRLNCLNRQANGKAAGHRIGHVDAVHDERTLIGTGAVHVEESVGPAHDTRQKGKGIFEALVLERDGAQLLVFERGGARGGLADWLAVRFDGERLAEAREIENDLQVLRWRHDEIDPRLVKTCQEQHERVAAGLDRIECEAPAAVGGLNERLTVNKRINRQRHGDAGKSEAG